MMASRIAIWLWSQPISRLLLCPPWDSVTTTPEVMAKESSEHSCFFLVSRYFPTLWANLSKFLISLETVMPIWIKERSSLGFSDFSWNSTTESKLISNYSNKSRISLNTNGIMILIRLLMTRKRKLSYFSFRYGSKINYIVDSSSPPFYRVLINSSD